MIEGIFGLPGSGKTYLATKMAATRILNGEKVYTNFEMKGAQYFKDFNEFLEMKECCVIIDEAGIWLNARKWSEIPDTILYRLMESRKYRFDLIYTAQNPEMVETTLRRITNFMWHVKRFGRREWYYKKGKRMHRNAWWHTAYLYEPEKYRKVRTAPLWKERFRIDKRIANLYDTEKLIVRPGIV